MDLTGLEPRRSDLARGIVIARSASPLDTHAQRAMWSMLAAAGVTETDDQGDPDDPSTMIERQWLAAPWLPPSPEQLEAQRAAFEQTALAFGIDAIWCIKVETGIDGVAWLEATASAPGAADDDEPQQPEEGAEIVDAVFDEKAEVLYSAPDAPTLPDEDDDSDEDDDDDGDVTQVGSDIGVVLESQWRNGPPPRETSVGFPIEGYPEIIDEYDWESFGVALKLAGTGLPGEESVINAFFALWLSVYQDERADEFEAFQRADVVHDRKHRSALMWVEHFSVPATPSDQVQFLMWVVARIHDVLPVAWARFDAVDETIKSRAAVEPASGAFVLAGNPFADRFRRQGEEAALAWAVSQSAWSRRELAGMLIEVALAHDPDDPATAAVAERLLRRALVFDAGCDGTGYLAIVLIRQHRVDEAVALARADNRAEVRLLVVGETAEHAAADLGKALDLLDDELLTTTDPEELADLIGGIARHAPVELASVLERIPARQALVPYLYNASFSVERPQALAILRKVLALPAPPRDAGEARTALVMAWNNACIHAHALGEFRLAVELADGGQRYAVENPYIHHSAACAYAAVGMIDRAIEQVSHAIEHEYEHSEKMETDADLSPLHGDPRFSQLFVDWRTRRADLN